MDRSRALRWLAASVVAQMCLAALPGAAAANPGPAASAPTRKEPSSAKAAPKGTTRAPSGPLTPATDIVSAGPITDIYVGTDLACQLSYTADPAPEFYPSDTIPGDCGTFVASGGTLYAPDFVNHGTTATDGLGAYTPFTPVSQSSVTGSGSSGDPYKVVTMANAGIKFKITETDSYVVGADSYETDLQIQNISAVAASAVVYRAGDCFVANSDLGFGFQQPATGAVGCRNSVNGHAGNRVEEWIPVSAGSSYYEDGFAAVWTAIGQQLAFNNTCQTCTETADDGAGLSWNASLAAGASVTISHLTAFRLDCTITGTAGSDSLTGTAGDDVICAMGGNDTIASSDGYDLIDGGGGVDTISYASETGGVGVDLGFGATSKPDAVDSLFSLENVTGSAFDDFVISDSNNNILNGGGGVDTVSYSAAGAGVTVSLLSGTATGDGSDTLSGFENVLGSTLDDVITGDANNNDLSGDAGDDTFSGGAGNDRFNGEDGIDTVTYAGVGTGVTASLLLGTASGDGSDKLANIENLIGTSFTDQLTGDTGDNALSGGIGNDTLLATSGDDVLHGGAGNDYLGGSAGSDSLYGEDGNDIMAPGLDNDPVVDGGVGTDTVTYISEPVASGVNVNLATGVVTGGAGSDTLTVGSIENATGTQQSDTLTGNSGPNVLLAGNGDDTDTGGDGNDYMTGGPGVDSLTGGNGDDGLAPGPGDESTIDGGAGVDNITYFDATTPVTIDLAAGTATGGSGNDTITGFEKATGSPFNDTITGDAGANTLLGGNGDDTLNGAAGDDFLLASLGNDTLHGDDGNDRLAPGLGNDPVVDGGTGTDLVTYLLDVVATGVNVNLGAGTVTGGAGTDPLTSVEQVTGTNLDDTLTGSTAANQLFGVGGNDTLSALDGNDYLAGGAGNDGHDGGLGTDVCTDNVGTNTFTSCETIHNTAPDNALALSHPDLAEISYELSVGRWIASQEALQKSALRATR